MKKILLLLIVTTIFRDISYGQSSTAVLDKTVDFLPPPPNASAIVRYGSTGINKNTGTPNISIPLYSVKGIKLSTSVSLGYTSNGIKVDEVASRTGMGWAINAGGVITRAVRGVPDEWNTRHYPYAPIGFNWGTLMYMNRIATSSMHNGYDAEPDLFNFSFDGYSGSFVFNGNMTTPVLITKNGLKITANLTDNAPWNFKIITPEGLTYLFGGSAVEKTKRDQTIGRNFNEYIPTSWYLKEVQHQTGEKIIYNYSAYEYKYDNGVAQVMHSVSNCGPQGIETSINVNKVLGVLLSSIQSVSNTILFQYTTRLDCTDKLLSKIKYIVSNNALSSTDFVYTNVEASQSYAGESYFVYNRNTPYLTSIIENSQDNSLHNTHHFSYNDPQGRPARLSYAQDHWGMFNGQNNTSLIPKLSDAMYATFPDATADRNPEAAFAKKGMLEKIVYPTGGVTMLFYEPNIYNTTPADIITKHTLNCDVTGYTTPQEIYGIGTKTKYFQTNATDYAPKITIEYRANGSYLYTHNTGHVTIYSPDNQVIFDIGCNPDCPIFTYSLPYFSPGTYKMVLKAQGSPVTTLATLKYNGTSTPSNQFTKQAGGLRVAKIVTTGGAEGIPSIKKYYYGTYNNLYTSSLSYLIGEPLYLSSRKCQAYGQTFTNPELSSSSILHLGFFNNNFVSYNSVVEGYGEDFENGGTESKFYTNTDALGQIVWNNDIKNSPYSNFSSAYNGRILSETILKKSSSGSLIPLKKSEFTYEDDFENETIVQGYTTARDFNFAVSSFDTTCNTVSCSGNLIQNLGGFNMVRYSVFSSWVHPKTQTETIYDQDGNNPLVTVADLRYDNPNNF
ncbi:MAG: hypothetical protein H7329_19345, partial [Opitutaceae bacterium]|nr:hypothetical protein [Cytophagales bacterium]